MKRVKTKKSRKPRTWIYGEFKIWLNQKKVIDTLNAIRKLKGFAHARLAAAEVTVSARVGAPTPKKLGEIKRAVESISGVERVYLDLDLGL